MARRSDHGRDELKALILDTGRQIMAEGGYARFSAREVAKRIGYSVGTVMHVFGNVDRLVMEINARTFRLWTEWLEHRLDGAKGRERILVLVQGYFDFAQIHRNLWAAIDELRVPEGMLMETALASERVHLTDVITREVAAVLPGNGRADASALASSMIAAVHGHCAFQLGGTFTLMGVEKPAELAAARIMETLSARGALTVS
ncbi:TetR family transcriptional regulator [Novosphingobium barchaimii LL02]|uniref:TetR family transcriptional regulator n=1 Tax=Novosphingobium barchaimii LL02 TaxID=1114963 RepID=A0A0J7Y5W1_9SPHN|nr:TetR/AcrR family transcriptional regulator [Novosphingobium barchaimii]KMS59314.1 TetR family transcriptional regulator [Novosphingobium barchaimii LL02]